MKKRFLLLIVALTAALTASAQDNFIFEMPDDFAAVLDKWRNYAKHKEYEEETETIYDITNREKALIDAKK